MNKVFETLRHEKDTNKTGTFFKIQVLETHKCERIIQEASEYQTSLLLEILRFKNIGTRLKGNLCSIVEGYAFAYP